MRAFFNLLTLQERRKLFLLFFAVVLMAVLEVVSVGSMMPFLQVASEPASTHDNVYLSWIYNTLGFESTNTFLIALGVGALLALVSSNAFIVLTTWGLQRYVWGLNHSLSHRLLRSYLSRRYEYFLNRNSSELGKNILEEVKEVTGKMLLPALRGGAKAIVSLAILGFLFYVDWTVALIVATVLGVAYSSLYYAVRQRLDQTGKGRVEANTQRYKFVSEAFGGIKEVKLYEKENSFLNRYAGPSRRFSSTQAQYHVIKQAPRYILEAIAFGGIILIAVYLIALRDDFQQVIPILGLYAFAGYRLMPSLQQAFKGLASARFNIAALDKIKRDLQKETTKETHTSSNNVGATKENRLEMRNQLVLDNVYYKYPGAREPAIKDLSMKVPVQSTVGLIGKTGSGKTTTVDLILGLLRPQNGVISVDGDPLQGSKIRRWQKNIGYVPQQIYLTDDTVTRNIAYGVPEKDIDMERVQDAAKQANINRLVEKELPSQWETVVGENGVKLSGGQRQRLGIARALYRQPSVLVFDEATSALDMSTETDVMEAIYTLQNDHTIIMISHRLKTVRRADIVIRLENGTNTEQGDYKKVA